jgi:geranylgeranyl reductase family protein
MVEKIIYDLIIIGAGPAGSAAALYGKKYNLKTLLLEKAFYPRDKICGDAISGKSMGVLDDLGLLDEARKLPGTVIDSFAFGSPAGKIIEIPLCDKKSDPPKGLVIQRKVFDPFLFGHAKDAAEKTVEGFTVNDIIVKEGAVCGVIGKNDKGEEQRFYGKIVLGADGYQSVVGHKAGIYNRDPKHWVVALRQYYRNVEVKQRVLEIHFVDEIIPGYFWIFPMNDGLANVGIGMLYDSIKKNNVNLKEEMAKIIRENPLFRERFLGAEALEEPKGWNLPVGSIRRKITGDGFMLLGDAAGLIDPFSGEGIGNALFSAKTAVEHASRAIESNDFSDRNLSRYEDDLWKKIGGDLRLSAKLQKLGRKKSLLNLVINKAHNNPQINGLITDIITGKLPKSKLLNPLFYMKILFN